MAASHSVVVSGALLSSLLFEHSCSIEAQDGILLGEVSHRITNTLSDSQINNEQHETIYSIQNFMAFPKPFFFYDSSGKMTIESIAFVTHLAQGDNGEIIGWYKFRRNSSTAISLRERAVHRQLCEQSSKAIFGLFTESSSSNKATHVAEHVFYRQNGQKMEALPLHITNLKDTDHAQYRSYPLATCQTGTFSQVLSALNNQSSQESTVEKAENINKKLQAKIAEKCSVLVKAEKRCEELHQEVAKLELMVSQRMFKS